MLQLLYLQRADWTSRYLVIWHAGSTAFPFYPKRGLKIQSSSARRHVHSINFVSFFHEEWVENSTLPLLLDTLTVFHFLRRAEYLTCRLDSIFLPEEGIGKIQTSSASQRVFGISVLFPQECIENLHFFYQSIRWPLFHLSQERIENPALPGFFALRYVDRLLFPQSGWKTSSLTQLFPLFETKTVFTFLRFYTSFHVVRAWSLVFTLCALCLSVCVKPCT